MPDLVTCHHVDPVSASPNRAQRLRTRPELEFAGFAQMRAPSRGTREKPHDPVRDPSFVINGRFFGQSLSGVQRYGREIVGALDSVLVESGRAAALALPRGADAPAFEAIARRPARMWGGHGWEQIALPRGSGLPLLNLCNTGPMVHGRQVVCMHDTNVFDVPDSYRTSFRLFYAMLQPLLARRAAVITTVSQASASALAARFGLDHRRIAVLPNGHEHALAWLRDDAVVLRHGLVRPFVLLLGSLARHKNMGLLLRLAPALDTLGLDLVVAGGAGTVFAAAAGAQGPNVRVLGSVSDDELAGLLAHALCLAFPSWTEGFGLPIVEAMALGCPVVASDRASLPEVCGAAALKAAPDDPGAWLGHMRALTDSRALRRELVERGRLQASRFSWVTSARRYLELMERLA